jgi:hypothetical protein
MVAPAADGATVLLGGERSRAAAVDLIMRAPMGWLCKIGSPPRTLDQNAKFWAMCTALAASEITWSGDRQAKDDWHDLLVSGWCVAEGRPPKLLIGLEGERVSLAKHTHNLGVDGMSSLIDYTAAWAAVRGISVE